MSGFDVRLADARRSRALTFFSTMGLALILALGLLISRVDQSGDAQAIGPEADVTGQRVATAQRSAPSSELEAPGAGEALSTSLAELVRAEHAVFAEACDACPEVETVERTIGRNEFLGPILQNAGASGREAYLAAQALDPVFSVNRLRRGQDLKIYFETLPETGERRLAGLAFKPLADESRRTITVARSGEAFAARATQPTLEREWVRARGEVETSLYTAMLELGGTDRLVSEFTKIMGFAVDFRSVYPGDPFDVVFERTVTRSGDVVGTGEIAYLAFHGRGEPLEYYRFETPDGELGYYTAEGESAQRLLMKTPIDGARVSSSFGMRFHPVLRTNRPHNGTDFAAPRGTAIYAAGNGVVERADRFGSFGNYIRIRHANGYKTAYAHLQGFARGVRAGTRVTQGQTIGYVGTTGRSTGPHLHYEVHLNGTPVNPMALDLPTGRRLTAEELDLFEVERDRIRDLRDRALPAADTGPVLIAGRAEAPAASRNDAGD